MSKVDDALNAITYGVYIVSGRRGESVNGLTAAWVTRVSLDPTLVAVAVGKTRYTHDFITDGGAFAISILAEGQQDVGRFFGSVSGRETDKFARYANETRATGAPILADCAAWIDCRLVHSYDAGDHTIFVGEVADAGASGRPPMIFRVSDYF